MSAMFLYCLLVQYIIALGDKFMDIGNYIEIFQYASEGFLVSGISLISGLNVGVNAAGFNSRVKWGICKESFLSRSFNCS